MTLKIAILIPYMTNSTVEQPARNVIQVLPNFRDGKCNQKP